MASNLLLIVLFTLFSLSLTSVYSLSTRDVFSKQEDESYFEATSDQGSSMIDVEDLTKAQSLQALVAGSKVVLNKAVSKVTSTRRSLRRYARPQVGSLQVSAFAGTIIAAIIVTILIICVLYYFYRRHEEKKVHGHEKLKESSGIQTSETEDHV